MTRQAMPLARNTTLAIGGNRLELCHGGNCLITLLHAIERATSEILLEMYWFGSDQTGQRFAKALCEQARRGVRVCVTYDAVGSWETAPAMFAALRAAGCQVRVYNPLRAFRLRFRLGNRRDHRKLLLIDGRIGFTGGVNLADAWADVADGGMGFRDHIVRVEGPAVARLREVFAITWGRDLPEAPTPPAAGSAEVAVLYNDRLRQRRRIARAYLGAIRAARRRVWIENSYFIPNWLLRSALKKAVRRGADVRVLVPLVSDVPAVSFAMHRSYRQLLAAGVRVYEYPLAVLHSKVAVMDDWCTLGTHNLDYRSWLYNLEVNVGVLDRTTADALATNIAEAMAVSVQVDPVTWAYRPLFQRILEEFFYRLRRLM
jgi:cardiolipin synthase